MPPQGSAGEEDYFQEIERRFALLRGRPLFLSPRDAALVDRWWKAGVPLRVVLQAIESVFEKRGGGAAVHSLAYCRHAVEEAFAEWRESRLGASDAATPAAGAAPEEILSGLRRLLREHAAAAEGEDATSIRRAEEDLGDLLRRRRGKEPPGAAELERELEAVEARLLDALLEALPPVERESIQSTVEEQMTPAGARGSPRARQPEIVARLRAAIRERHGLPRLTLY